MLMLFRTWLGSWEHMNLEDTGQGEVRSQAWQRPLTEDPSQCLPHSRDLEKADSNLSGATENSQAVRQGWSACWHLHLPTAWLCTISFYLS